MNSQFTHSRQIWTPRDPSSTRVDNLRRLINRKHALNLQDYYNLHEYSITKYEFWNDLWEYFGVVYSTRPSSILQPGSKPYLPTWFPDARLNYAENLLQRNDDAIAITSGGELGTINHTTFRELRVLVSEMANGLRESGVGVGDRVAAIVTNSLTAVVIALATASIGAIFSSTATDMGAQGVLDRYTQIQPCLIFAETEVAYSGKSIDLTPKVCEIVNGLDKAGLDKVILLPSARDGKEISGIVPRSMTLSQFLSSSKHKKLSLRFEQLPFNHPLFILYSSGTSGPPKCIVHSAGGILLQDMKDIGIGLNLGRDDTYFQYTTTGWMMWPFMLTALALGTRIITYDGSPFYPDVKGFLKFVGDQGVTALGTSPRFLTEIQGRNIDPLSISPFDSLRTIAVTGAVLTAPVMEWTHKAFGGDKHLLSTSGGTDVCGAMVTGSPVLPVHAGEIQCKSLGMKVEVFDPSGKNIEHTGEPGELVITRPHVSLPIAFWGDDSGKKLYKAYFDFYPGIWRQGDFLVINPKTKGIIIQGRSDGVLNPSGVRFGSGEIYTVLDQFSSIIDDSICVGQRRPQDLDERVLLFVKMREGTKFDKGLDEAIRKAIRKGLSARHVPTYIFQVDDIPYTVNGKKIEIAVKQIVSGSNIKPSGTVANPESLKLYYKYRDIEAVIDVPKQMAKL